MRDYRPKFIRNLFSPAYWREWWRELWNDLWDPREETKSLRAGQMLLIVMLVAGTFVVIFSVLGWDHELSTAFLILGSVGALICFTEYSVMLGYNRLLRWWRDCKGRNQRRDGRRKRQAR
jgi:hypothetical protein